MKTKNLLMLIAVAGLMFLASCKKDETPSPLTTDEATATLTDVNTNYTADVTTYQNSEQVAVSDAVKNLDLPSGMSPVMPFKKKSFRQDFQKVFLSNPSKGGFLPDWEFPWDTYKGFSWTYSGGDLVKGSAVGANEVVIIFSYDGGTNNGKITYSGYATKTATVMGSTDTFMSSLNMNIKIDNVTYVTMSFTANASGSLSSVNASMSFDWTFGTSYSLKQSITFNVSSSQAGGHGSISLLEELKKDGSVLRGAYLSINITATQTTMTETITAKYRVKDVVIKAVMNIDQNTIFDGNPSNYMTVSIWTAGGAKIADVLFVEEPTGSGNWVPYLQFATGDPVPLTEYFSNSLSSEIGDFFSGASDIGFFK